MGYRTHLQKMSMDDFKKVSKMNETELIKYVNKRENEDFTEEEIYLTIKYVGKSLIQIYDVNENFEKEYSKNLFDMESMNNLAKDYGHQLFRIEKEGLLALIELYNEQVKETYKGYQKEIESVLDMENKSLKDEKEAFYVLYDFMRRFDRRVFEFGGDDNYLKDKRNYILDNDTFIVDSELLEYEIFNLVSLYNSFDWENEILIIEAS